jgi:hypothetical protein
VWWEENQPLAPEKFDLLLADFLSHAREGAVRAGSLRRRRPHEPDQGAGLHRVRVAFAVHPQPAAPPRGG